MLYAAVILTASGHLYTLERNTGSGYELIRAIQAHSTQILSVVLNNDASILSTVCYSEGKVKLWDLKQGGYVCISYSYSCADALRLTVARYALQEFMYCHLLQPQPQQAHCGLP